MTEVKQAASAPVSRRIKPARRLAGVVTLPGDKSISHRILMLAAAANGESRIRHLGTGEDVASTQRVLSALGVKFGQDGADLTVQGVGRTGFAAPSGPLDCGNSGTTMRLLAGLLAGIAHEFVLTGDESLSTRPMARIARPLREMGVDVELAEGDVPPVTIRGGRVRPTDYELPVASAQVKSAVLLAALSADGTTRLVEPVPTRDHTEIMLAHLGVPIEVSADTEEIQSEDPRRRGVRRTDSRTIALSGPHDWNGTEYDVPGDFSTAAYFIAAGTLLRKADLRIPGIVANSTRTGLMAVLSTMGAKLNWQKRRTVAGESVGDLQVTPSHLSARRVSGKLIPRLIDELPLLAVLATQAEGTTVIRDAGELRHKESDRLELTAENLRRMGAKIGTLEDGWAIEGPTALSGAQIATGGDHRIAMAFAVAALIADGETELDSADCVRVSCPEFFELLDALR
jgi:3-phosphoshikimate 1-carboxyvinyltransferase